MSKPYNANNLGFYDVNGQCVPEEGARGVPLQLDFSDATDITLDLSNLVQRKLISMVQGIFIDNSNNATQFQVSVNGLPKIKIAPGWQGYKQLLSPNPMNSILFTSNGGGTIPVVLLNFPVSQDTWPSSTGV